MEVMMVTSMLFTMVGQIQQGQAQAKQMKAQAEVADAQADAYTAQASTELASTDAQIAIEKASAAERTVDRLRNLREVTGELLVRGANAGISIGSGSIGTLVSDSQSQFGREQGIQGFNLKNTSSALQMAGEQQSSNLKSQSGALSTQSSLLRSQASNAKLSGYMNAAGTLMNYGYNTMQRGSVPENMGGGGSSYNPAVSPPPKKPARI